MNPQQPLGVQAAAASCGLLLMDTQARRAGRLGQRQGSSSLQGLLGSANSKEGSKALGHGGALYRASFLGRAAMSGKMSSQAVLDTPKLPYKAPAEVAPCAATLNTGIPGCPCHPLFPQHTGEGAGWGFTLQGSPGVPGVAQPHRPCLPHSCSAKDTWEQHPSGPRHSFQLLTPRQLPAQPSTSLGAWETGKSGGRWEVTGGTRGTIPQPPTPSRGVSPQGCPRSWSPSPAC